MVRGKSILLRLSISYAKDFFLPYYIILFYDKGSIKFKTYRGYSYKFSAIACPVGDKGKKVDPAN